MFEQLSSRQKGRHKCRSANTEPNLAEVRQYTDEDKMQREWWQGEGRDFPLDSDDSIRHFKKW